MVGTFQKSEGVEIKLRDTDRSHAALLQYFIRFKNSIFGTDLHNKPFLCK